MLSSTMIFEAGRRIYDSKNVETFTPKHLHQNEAKTENRLAACCFVLFCFVFVVNSGRGGP